MKKILAGVLLACVLMFLCSCGGGSSPSSAPANSDRKESAGTTAEKTPAVPDDTTAFCNLIEKEYPGFIDSCIDSDTGGVSVTYLDHDVSDYIKAGLYYSAYSKTRAQFPKVALVIGTLASDYAEEKGAPIVEITIMYYPEADKENAITWRSTDGEKGLFTDSSVPGLEGSAVDLPYYEIDQYIDSISGKNIAKGKGMNAPASSESANGGLSTEQRNALAKANSYLSFSNFSYQGLIEQLEYSGFEHDAAVYAADNCGADWFEQAEKKAESYLSVSSFSRTSLIEQLEYSGFTNEEAVHGADYALGKPTGDGLTSGQSNALKKAESYLSYSSFSYSGLVDQLEYSGFEHEDAVFAADNCGADWNEQAVKKAKSYLEYSSFSKKRLIEQLVYSGFTKEQAKYGADVAFGD